MAPRNVPPLPSNAKDTMEVINRNARDTPAAIVASTPPFAFTSGAKEYLNFFIKNLSLNVHLIIITRESPDIYLGSISMEGRLLSIEDNELNLSRTLGISFLKDTLKLDFKEDILNYIYELSEGWIGGLQLIASSANIKSEKEIFKLNFKNRVIEEYINLDGIPVKIVDTAGIRETEDIVEKIGVEKSKEKIDEADLVVLMLDISRDFEEEDREIVNYIKDKKHIVLLNKVDLDYKINRDSLIDLENILEVSIRNDEGIEAFKDKIKELKSIIEAKKLNVEIEVDGGVKLENARDIIDFGADILVVGSGIFGSKDIIQTTKEFTKI